MTERSRAIIFPSNFLFRLTEATFFITTFLIIPDREQPVRQFADGTLSSRRPSKRQLSRESHSECSSILSLLRAFAGKCWHVSVIGSYRSTPRFLVLLAGRSPLTCSSSQALTWKWSASTLSSNVWSCENMSWTGMKSPLELRTPPLTFSSTGNCAAWSQASKVRVCWYWTVSCVL